MGQQGSTSSSQVAGKHSRQRAVKTLLAALVIAALVVFFAFDLGRYLSLGYLQTRMAAFEAYYAEHRLATVGLYMGIYIIATALSFPGATVLTLLGGALFGLGFGLLIVSVASSIGATLAFLGARFFFRDLVQAKFGDRLQTINAGIARDGDFYLFTLRLVPIVPFFIINLAMGLTPIKAWRFFLVSQIGMLLGTAVYVNAGTELSRITSLGDIASPTLLLSFALLGVFPLASRKILQAIKKRKALRPYPRPKQFDYNLVVIGAGAAGLVSSYIAATVRAKVALIEKHAMGGDCLNTGCVPSKTLIRSTQFLAEAKRAKELGIAAVKVEFSFADIMERVQRVIKAIAPHDSRQRYRELGVDCLEGTAHIKSPYEVEVNGQVLTTRNIIVATGGRPYLPPLLGLQKIPYVTSDTVWDLRELPRRLLVLGGGPIGCELAQAFARMDTQVTVLDVAPRLLMKEDPEVAVAVEQRFADEGIRVLTDHVLKHFDRCDGEPRATVTHQGQGFDLAFDMLLVAVGRRANTTGFGLEELGVRLAAAGTIEADEFMRTNIPNIYVCGDVTGQLQFTHTAAHEAWYAAVNAIFSPFRSFSVDYRVIPWATFTDPEVARVGHNEASAAAAGLSYEVSRYEIKELDRALSDEKAYGFVKVLTPPRSDKILGVTIVGPHSSEMISEFITAMRHGLGLNKILSTIHIYPTLAEANKYAAGVWKKAHAPQKLLHYVERFHSWRRGAGFTAKQGGV